MLAGSFAASAATDRDGSEFAAGKWWQETGYAGLGNPNEVLGLVEYDAASGVRPTVNGSGVKTRVYTNYFDSNDNTADDSHYMQRHYFHSDWCSDDNYTESDFGDVLSSIDTFKDVAEANPTAKELSYPISLGETYKTWGLSPKVELMTDSKNCQDFDAVVMVKQDGEYITANYPAAPGKKKTAAAKQADEAGAAVPLYYLIEGVNSKLGSTMRNQSKGVYVAAGSKFVVR